MKASLFSFHFSSLTLLLLQDDFTAQLPALAKPPKEQRLKLMRYQFDMVGNMKNACAAEEAVHRSRRTSEEIGAILCNNR